MEGEKLHWILQFNLPTPDNGYPRYFPLSELSFGVHEMVRAGPGVIYSDPLIDLSCEGILEELESLKGVIWLLTRMEVGLVFVDWVVLLLAGKASHVLLGPCVKFLLLSQL